MGIQVSGAGVNTNKQETPATEEKKTAKKAAKKATAAKTPINAGAQAPAANVNSDKAEAAMQADAPVETADTKTEIGGKSETVSFVCALGDPSRIDTTQEEKGGPKRKDPTIVGYRFVATEDINVPDVPPDPKADFAKNLFSFDAQAVHNTRLVKAGENIDLTKAETALLISRPEYNSVFSGGSIPVNARYTQKVFKDASGKPMEATADNKGGGWSVSIAAMSNGQSIKDVEMVPVLQYTVVNTSGKNIRKERTIIAGFEKWQDLCTVRTGGGAGRTAGSKSAAKAVYNPKAAAFMANMFGDIVNNKKAQ